MGENSSVCTPRRVGYVTSEQKKMLADLVTSDIELMGGKITQKFSYKVAQRRWQEIALKVNACGGGPCKDWKQWRKCWQDSKAKMKGKQANINRHARATGGGPPLEENLTEEEAKIMAVIAPALISGHSGASESIVSFTMEDNEIQSPPSNIDEGATSSTSSASTNADIAISFNEELSKSDNECEEEKGKKKTTKGSMMAAMAMVKNSEEFLNIEKKKLALKEIKLNIEKERLELERGNQKMLKEMNESLKKIIKFMEEKTYK